MREKGVYPVRASKEGYIYYKDHYATMSISGVPQLLFRWIPTPIGFFYVKMRSLVSNIIKLLRKKH